MKYILSLVFNVNHHITVNFLEENYNGLVLTIFKIIEF